MKYTIIAEEDGREATQYVESRRPVETIDVTFVNELVAPDVYKDYWEAFEQALTTKSKEEDK